jgi:hypothetical protein
MVDRLQSPPDATGFETSRHWVHQARKTISNNVAAGCPEVNDVFRQRFSVSQLVYELGGAAANRRVRRASAALSLQVVLRAPDRTVPVESD